MAVGFPHPLQNAAWDRTGWLDSDYPFHLATSITIKLTEMHFDNHQQRIDVGC